MAAAIMQQLAGGLVDVRSAGTDPDAQVHDLSAIAVAELGADMSNQVPTRLEPRMLTAADRIIVLGDEARVDAVEGMRAPIETWLIPDPADQGIDGLQRVRLMRDDIAERVRKLMQAMTDKREERNDPYLAHPRVRSRQQRRANARSRSRATRRRAQSARRSGQLRLLRLVADSRHHSLRLSPAGRTGHLPAHLSHHLKKLVESDSWNETSVDAGCTTASRGCARPHSGVRVELHAVARDPCVEATEYQP